MMCTILLVENEPYHQIWLSQELADEGYTVVTAASGREALNYLNTHHPDLIILDIFIPDIDGLDLLGRLRGMHPRLPVIIHTGYAA